MDGFTLQLFSLAVRKIRTLHTAADQLANHSSSGDMFHATNSDLQVLQWSPTRVEQDRAV
jgi:hypothetical protein